MVVIKPSGVSYDEMKADAKPALKKEMERINISCGKLARNASVGETTADETAGHSRL